MSVKDKFVGLVVSFKKTYGFISRKDDNDIFVHYSDIESDGYKCLRPGQKVAYSIGTNHRGEPKAIEVVVVEDVVRK